MNKMVLNASTLRGVTRTQISFWIKTYIHPPPQTHGFIYCNSNCIEMEMFPMWLRCSLDSAAPRSTWSSPTGLQDYATAPPNNRL